MASPGKYLLHCAKVALKRLVFWYPRPSKRPANSGNPEFEVQDKEGVSGNQSSGAAAFFRNYCHAILLISILLAGLGFRVYRLNDEALWTDEAVSVTHLSAPTLVGS